MTTASRPSTPAIELANPTVDSFQCQYPLNISQCEPVLMFHNTTFETKAMLYAPEGVALISFYFPAGATYMEWVCNIPAGYSFSLQYDLIRYYRVQPGPSSACLRDVTTTYPFVSYTTSVFRSYTAFPPISTVPSLASLATKTVPFPTAAYPTITVNPDFLFAPTSRSSIPTPTPTQQLGLSTSESRKPKTAAIAGGIVGAVVVILLALVVIFLLLRQRRRGKPREIDPFVLNPEHMAPSGLQTSTTMSQATMSSAQMSGMTSNHDLSLPRSNRPVVPRIATSNYVGASTSGPTSSSRIRSTAQLLSAVNTLPPSSWQKIHTQQDIVSPGSEQQQQADVARIINVLHSISHLDGGERHLLASLLAAQSSTGDGNGNREPLPPPYI